MLLKRDQFLQTNYEGLALCGRVYRDSVHVGIYWNTPGERKVFHFLNGKDIRIEDISDQVFAEFYFLPINFDQDLLPSLTAVAELVAENKLNGFTFRREGAFYDGGKFEFVEGAFTGKIAPEKFVNCAVFTLAFLKTYEIDLIDWATWPNADPANRNFLDDWLDVNNIPLPERNLYYNLTKVVRGKHVLVSPLTHTQPSPYPENSPLADQFVATA